MPIKSKDRAEEMNRLLVTQGHVTRSMKYGWKPDDEEQAAINARAARLIELVELLECYKAGQHSYGEGHEDITPERYVNERIATWLKHNPLALTNQRMHELLEENILTGNLDCGNVCGVTIQIGEGEKAYHYSVMADDFVALRGGGRVLFRVPESIAEYFRQQGRRQLQRSLQRELGL